MSLETKDYSKLYIAGLEDEISKSDLVQEFSKYGSIKSTWIRNTKPKFGFIEFFKISDAKNALDNFSLQNSKLGKNLRLEYSTNIIKPSFKTNQFTAPNQFTHTYEPFLNHPYPVHEFFESNFYPGLVNQHYPPRIPSLLPSEYVFPIDESLIINNSKRRYLLANENKIPPLLDELVDYRKINVPQAIPSLIDLQDEYDHLPLLNENLEFTSKFVTSPDRFSNRYSSKNSSILNFKPEEKLKKISIDEQVPKLLPEYLDQLYRNKKLKRRDSIDSVEELQEQNRIKGSDLREMNYIDTFSKMAPYNYLSEKYSHNFKTVGLIDNPKFALDLEKNGNEYKKKYNECHIQHMDMDDYKRSKSEHKSRSSQIESRYKRSSSKESNRSISPMKKFIDEMAASYASYKKAQKVKKNKEMRKSRSRSRSKNRVQDYKKSKETVTPLMDFIKLFKK